MSNAEIRRGTWLSGMDSNHDKLLQRELCYHYTTGQHRREGSDYASRATLAKKNLGQKEEGTDPLGIAPRPKGAERKGMRASG